MSATSPESPPLWVPGELRVLIVDDEPDMRHGLRLLVESLGTEVREASSAEAALEVCAEWPPHIVLSDITMEGMSGIDLLSILAVRRPEVRVVLITGFGTIQLAVEAMHRGAAHFITKPFDNEEVLDAVRRYGQETLARERSRRAEAGAGRATIVARDPRMQALLALVERVAATPMSVLIQGESGTGKELVARTIHEKSDRSDLPFLAVNSAALPDSLLESELFGYRRGAFTGADRRREGIFAQARGGTVFLDEIALMSPAFQGKLLRVLQERTVVPLGSAEEEPVEFRLVAATSRDLQVLVTRGEFREDLFYRLRVVTLEIPPLRERRDDIVPLALHFLEKYRGWIDEHGETFPRLSPAAEERLREHPWKGNVRELENCMQRALVLSAGGEILPGHLELGDERGIWSLSETETLSYEEEKQRALRTFQRRFIERALSQSDGNVTRAAERCGLTRAALQRIIRSLGLDRNRFER